MALVTTGEIQGCVGSDTFSATTRGRRIANTLDKKQRAVFGIKLRRLFLSTFKEARTVLKRDGNSETPRKHHQELVVVPTQERTKHLKLPKVACV